MCKIINTSFKIINKKCKIINKKCKIINTTEGKKGFRFQVFYNETRKDCLKEQKG